jgi:hypothetical protein
LISRRAIQLESKTILFSPDDAVPFVDRIQALVKIRVTDELTGGPPESRMTIQVREQGLIPRVASDGLAGLVGIPRQVFPGLQTIDYFVHLTIRAERYLPRDLEVKLPKNPSFPATFTPSQINVALHREPVFIAGRTVRVVSNVTAPLPGAQISVTGIWRTPPPANIVVAPDPPNLVSIQPPLYSDRAALTQLLRRRDLVPVLANDKALVENLSPGANPIRLSNRQGLGPGNILFIDAEQADLAEFIAIKSVPTVAPADQPTLVTLNYPLIFAHRRGAVVRRVTPQPPGANLQFSVSALSGDVCVFLGGLTGLAAAQHVETTGAPGPDEHHKVMSFSVTSDPAGYYRLPPLSRVAQLKIHAEKTVGIQTFKATRIFRPDYQQRENHLDFTLAP